MNTADAQPAYLAGLNDAQRDAATYGSGATQSGGPLLVIAGAGTGNGFQALREFHAMQFFTAEDDAVRICA